MQKEQRRALNGLAAIAMGLGLGAVVFARSGARALGLEERPRSAWSLRLFGVRELCLAYGLARAARSGDAGQGRLMADVITVAQVGDSILAGVLLGRGEVSRRFAMIVWGGVVPTLLATRMARANSPSALSGSYRAPLAVWRRFF